MTFIDFISEFSIAISVNQAYDTTSQSQRLYSTPTSNPAKASSNNATWKDSIASVGFTSSLQTHEQS